MGLLDSLLRTMKLLTLDEGDPRVSIFSSNVPVVSADSSRMLPPSSVSNPSVAKPLRLPVDYRTLPVQWPSSETLTPPIHRPEFSSNAALVSPPLVSPSSYSYPAEHSSVIIPSCNCRTFTLGHTWPMVREFAPLWDMTPTWQSEWTESDIRKEECRRLVWSSVMLSAGHSSYTAASSDIQTQQLFLMDPRNVSQTPVLTVFIVNEG